MIFTLDQAERNPFSGVGIYRGRYPDSGHPEKRIFENLMTKFIETGCVVHKKRERTKKTTKEDNKLNVLLTVTEDSIRVKVIYVRLFVYGKVVLFDPANLATSRYICV